MGSADNIAVGTSFTEMSYPNNNFGFKAHYQAMSKDWIDNTNVVRTVNYGVRHIPQSCVDPFCYFYLENMKILPMNPNIWQNKGLVIHMFYINAWTEEIACVRFPFNTTYMIDNVGITLHDGPGTLSPILHQYQYNKSDTEVCFTTGNGCITVPSAQTFGEYNILNYITNMVAKQRILQSYLGPGCHMSQNLTFEAYGKDLNLLCIWNTHELSKRSALMMKITKMEFHGPNVNGDIGRN